MKAEERIILKKLKNDKKAILFCRFQQIGLFEARNISFSNNSVLEPLTTHPFPRVPFCDKKTRSSPALGV